MTSLHYPNQSQAKGSLEAEVYALMRKGSRCNSEPSESPIGERALSGASGSRADGSKVGSLPKNPNPRVRNKASCVKNK